MFYPKYLRASRIYDAMTQEKNKQQEKLDKRAAALRENLKRRKPVKKPQQTQKEDK
jgi:hypothetical protein